MTQYRRPFLKPEHHWPTLTWPRQILIGGEPADVTEFVRSYSEWIPGSNFPKRLVNAEPGAIVRGKRRDFCRTWRNQTGASVPGSHFLQENSGSAIGRSVADWIGAWIIGVARAATAPLKGGHIAL